MIHKQQTTSLLSLVLQMIPSTVSPPPRSNTPAAVSFSSSCNLVTLTFGLSTPLSFPSLLPYSRTCRQPLTDGGWPAADPAGAWYYASLVSKFFSKAEHPRSSPLRSPVKVLVIVSTARFPLFLVVLARSMARARGGR